MKRGFAPTDENGVTHWRGSYTTLIFIAGHTAKGRGYQSRTACIVERLRRKAMDYGRTRMSLFATSTGGVACRQGLIHVLTEVLTRRSLSLICSILPSSPPRRRCTPPARRVGTHAHRWA